MAATIPNPFATRFIRPDAVPYSSTDCIRVEEMVTKFQELGFRAAIVGPHGAGKTCLWSTLLHQLESKHHVSIGRACFPREQSWSDVCRQLRRWPMQGKGARGVMGVDGFEQLSHWQRVLLVRLTRRRNLGLLVTSHRDFSDAFLRLPIMRLPTLCVIRPNMNTLRQSLLAIRDHWLQELQYRQFKKTQAWAAIECEARSRFDRLLADSWLEKLGEQYRWNLREVLFALYDRWECDGHPTG